MSTTRYHHGRLREALVDAAVEAARERGPDGLALRELARRVGVSHNAAYRHFADREALVAEVAAEGLRQMMATLQRRLAEVSSQDPVVRARRRLAALARGYVEFAVTEPGLFRVVFTAYPTLSDPRDAELPEDLDTFGLLSSTLDDLVDVGVLHPDARPGAEISCWSGVHGFAMLHLDGPMRDVPAPDRDALLEHLIAAFDRSYAATTGTPIAPGDLVP